MNTCDLSVAEDHAMLDVGVDDGDAIANAGIRTNVGMFKMTVSTSPKFFDLSLASSTIWLAARISSFLPVSSHHPSSYDASTFLLVSISCWMASVISNSPLADGAIWSIAV